MARIIDSAMWFQSIEFDVLTGESWDDTVEWTSFPIETGIAATDHGVVQPTTLSLVGVITDSPLPPAIPVPQRARQVYSKLIDMARRKSLLTVVTGLRVLRNMVIEGVGLAQDQNSGLAIRPVVKLKEIRLVASVTVDIPAALLAVDVKAGADAATDAGAQSGGPPAGEVASATNKSLAIKLLDGLSSSGVSVTDLVAP